MSEHIIETEVCAGTPFVPIGGTGKLREEIVRCEDCKHFTFDKSDHEYRSGWWCIRWETDRVEQDGFCKWGERK